MNPLQGDSVNNRNCLCTSCDSKSDSDHDTVKRLLAQESKINKLLTGKYYIRIKDSDTLEALIKTTALHDALRRQLLSSTESSTATLKPKQSSREINKTFVEDNKSSDICKLMDLVDKCAVMGLIKLSECCSCCTCSSKFQLNGNVQKGRKNRQAHTGGNIASRSSLVSKRETAEAKNIKSDPCTCTSFKKENVIKSREISEKMRPEKQIIERDRLCKATSNQKLLSLNNRKLRKSYHKLKRAKIFPSPYMENIGEGGNKIIRTPEQKFALDEKKLMEMAKLAEKIILDGFKTDHQTLIKKNPIAMVRNSAEEKMIHEKKTVSASKDQDGKRHAPRTELKNNKKLLQQLASLANYNREIAKRPEKFGSSRGSDLVQNSKESKHPPRNDPAKIANKIKKQLPINSTPGKEPIKSNTDTVSDIEKLGFIHSIKKNDPAYFNKPSSNSLIKINKSKLESRSMVLIRKRLRLLSAPLRYRPHVQIREKPKLHQESVPGRHKKSSGFRQRNLKSGSHALKRCYCTVKLKINETKSNISKSKNASNRNLNFKDNKSIDSKKLSKLNIHDPKYMSEHSTKCECSDYVNQNKAGRRNERPTEKESNAHLEIKYDVTDNKQTIKKYRAQDASAKNKLSVHALISGCICDELEELIYRHNQPNIELGLKSTSKHHVSNDPRNGWREDKGRYKGHRGKQNSRLRTKSTVTDATITTKNARKRRNQCVQTIINVSSKQKQELEISMKQLEKKKPNNCNPRFSIELFNKGYDNGFQIIQSKVKFVYERDDGTKRPPIKHSNTNSSTQISKFTNTKHDLHRCLCTLQLGKQEKKNHNHRKGSKVTMMQPTNNVDESQSRAKLKILRPNKLKVELVKIEKRRFNFSLASRSMQLPRTKKIPSVLTYPNSEAILKRNKTKLSDDTTHRGRLICLRKLFKNKPYCLFSPIYRDNELNTKIGPSKDLQNHMLLRNKKIEQCLLFDLARKRSLCTFKLGKKGEHYRRNRIKSNTKSNIVADKINSKFQKGTKLIPRKYSDQLRPKSLKPSVLKKNECNTLKHFGFVTGKNKMKSKSNDTRTLRSRSTLSYVNSDLQQRNTSLQKFKKMRKCSELFHLPQRAREMYSNNFLKQSVKMGSNFSFNIEFYKSITPENNYNQYKSKNLNVNVLHDKQKCKLLTKRYSSHRNTRLETERVSPTPNRCFLQISKMDEHIRDSRLLLPLGTNQLTQVYAVSTVATAENKINIPQILEVDHDFSYIDPYYRTYPNNTPSHTKQWQYFNKSLRSGLSISHLNASMIAFNTKNVQSYIRECKYKLLQFSSKDRSSLAFASNESIRFETAFSCKIDYLKKICSKKRQILRSAQSQNDRLELRQRTSENPETERAQNITQLSQLTGIQPLLKRCYCTMNIQVARQKRKLLDYECEPGICTPGDCDPYECQKLIMKRLMRQVSRMSGTESRSKSSSCETTSTGSCVKKLQSDFSETKHRTRGNDPRSKPRPRRVRPQGVKYQTLPRTAQAPTPAPTHRQAVRVGSTFSFDVEFSKGGSSKSLPTTDFVRVPRRQTSSRSSNYHRRNMDRGTKYGGRRRHRETQSMMNEMRHRASSVTPMMKRCFCTLKLQKKGRQQKERELRGIDHGTSTPPKFSVERPVLRTTERGQNTRRKQRLLPYECEPGICVPGECDPYECLELIKRRNKHTKDFGTDSIASSISSSSMTSSEKRQRKQIQTRKIRAKKAKSRETSVRSKPSVMSIDRPVEKRASKPSRQAVKISSTFSFNIEFSKDKIGSSDNSDTRPSEVYVQKTPKHVRKQVYAHRRMRESSSQHRRGTRDDDSQIGKYQHVQSTMTSSFLKRCFCTAKLQGINVEEATGARQHRSLARLKRCFCILRLMTASKRRRLGGSVGHESTTPISDRRVGMTQTRGRFAPGELEAAVMTQTRERFPALLPYECEPGVCEPGFCDPNECIKLIKKRLRKEKMTGTPRPRTISTSSSFTSYQSIMTQSRSAWPKGKITQTRTPRRRERRRRRDYAFRERVLQRSVVSPVSPQRQAVRIGSNFSFNIEFYKDKGSNNLNVQAPTALVKKSRPIRIRTRSHGAYRRIRTRDRGLRGRRFSALNRDSQVDPTESRDIGLGPMLRRCFCTLKLQNQAKIKGKSKALTRIASRPVSKGASNAETKAAAKAETKAVVKAETKAAAKAESKAAAKAETKAAAKAETKVASKAMSKAASKTETKVAPKAASKVASKAEAIGYTKAETGVDTKAEITEKKDKADKKRKKSKNNCLCPPPVKEIATLHTKSAMTAKKMKEHVSVKKSKGSIVTVKIPKRRKVFPYKLLPYECEPGICVPGECDPYECLKLINKRAMYSSGTSTDRRGIKSTSNMTDYGHGHRHSETQSLMQRKKLLKTRDTRIRDREIRPHRERVYRERRPESRSTIVEKATKQAVKLGSNFNFDIEFFKDKSHGNPVVSSRPIKRDIAYDKPRRTSSRSTEWRSTYSRNQRAQFSRANRAKDSQVFSPSMRSTLTGPVEPFLKRCFCTLQLHCKTENQGNPFECMSDALRRGKPYKCEPDVCVSGECDPYECLKKVKRRIPTRRADNEPYEHRSISSSTDEEIKHRRMQARSYQIRRNIKTPRCDDQCQDVIGSRSITSSSDRRKHRPRIKARSYSPSGRYDKTIGRSDVTSRNNDKTSRNDKTRRDQNQADTSPNRQALRYGSSFSLNIEFSREKSPKVPSAREVKQTVKKKENNKVNAMYETVPRSYKRRREPKSNKTYSISSCGRKDCHEDVRMQSQFERTDSKGMGTPLLKRCFCTLKLEKQGKQRIPQQIEPSFKCISTHTKTKVECEPVVREIGTKTKHCKCDKVTKKEKKKKIKKGKSCQCPEPEKFPCKEGNDCKCCKCNTYILQSMGYRCKKGKGCKCAECKTRALELNDFPCKKGKECKCCQCNASSTKQDNSVSVNQDKIKKRKGCKCPTYNPVPESVKTENRKNEFPCKKGQQCKCCRCNAIDTPLNQDQIPEKKDKSKKKNKCKCNQKKSNCKCNQKKSNCKCNESCLCEPVPTSDKKISTTEKFEPLQKFVPLECKEVCEIGEYSPHKRFKKEDRRRPDSLDMSSKRTSRASRMAAQFIPGYTHKRIEYKGEPYTPDNIVTVVEEPRYPFLHGKDARQGVKISSNFSFNVEFFKEMLPPVVENDKKVDKKYSPRQKREYGRETKNDYYSDKKDTYSTELQPRSDRTRTTPSRVTMLKKCFCNFKLQKPIHHQSLAVYRLEGIRPMSCFQSSEYRIQFQTQQETNYFKTDPQELETIMSYAPIRYKINNNKNCRSRCKINFDRVDTTKKEAHLNCIPKHTCTKQSTVKNIIYYFKNLLSKRFNKQNIRNTERCVELKTKTTNKQSLIGILKSFKSERHPNKAAIADLKKSKSLKVSKVNENDDYKKKYSRFQSGDHQGTKSQNTGIKFKKNCQHCQIKFKQANFMHDKVRFTTLRSTKTLKRKPKNVFLTVQEKDTKAVTFLFKRQKCYNSVDIKKIKLCSCCGGFKRIKNLPSANTFLDKKNKLLEYSEEAMTTEISKDVIPIPTKTDIPNEETELLKKKYQQSCPCCVFRSVCQPNNKQGKREAERSAEITHHRECVDCKQLGPIGPAESEKEAFKSESKCYRIPKKKDKEDLEQEAITRGNIPKADDKKKVVESKIKEKSKKLSKCNNMHASTCVTEVVRNLHRSVSDPKSTYRKCKSYLRDYMRASTKIKKPVNNGPNVEKLQFLKLRCAGKCIKPRVEVREDYPATNVRKHYNNADRKKGFHVLKPSLRRHPSCGFLLRNKPSFSAYYKCARSHPCCLTILQVWRRIMDVILFLMAIAVSSPCLLSLNLCRALKCCLLCKW